MSAGRERASPVRIAPASEGARWRELVERHGSPLLVLELDEVRRCYRALRRALPGVELHYAVKALPQPEVVAALLAEGAGLDLASAGEIALVQALGVDPRHTIHTHPIKSDAEIRAALRFGCTSFVVDNAFELQKFVRYRHRVGLLLRVSFRAASARVDLSRKFGCDPDQVPQLLAQANLLGVHVKGLSFHVGSQCASPDGHVGAIERCRALLEQHRETGGAPMSVLDIGGGFPVAEVEGAQGARLEAELARFCAPIRGALAALPDDVEVLAEPGRFLCASAGTLVATVVGKARRGGQRWFYLDDGLYGGFSGQLYDGARYPLTAFGAGSALEPAVLAGPTCDSVDIVAPQAALPDLGLGELVIARQAGAYSVASASGFNSLPRPRVVVVDGCDAAAPGAPAHVTPFEAPVEGGQ